MLLKIENLKTHFFTEAGIVRAVDGVSLSLQAGRSLGLVGESGCGKSMTALSILRLVPPPGRIVEGEIVFKERDLLTLSSEEMRRVRGNEISMIFQEPMTSLNPVYTVGNQVGEAFRLHQKLGRKEARAKSIEMFQLVGIPSPESRIKDYPHQMSGGMRQRVMIAMALACRPDLLIADEPSTALDVTIQAQILELLISLQNEMGMAMILITHDLGIIAETVQDVCIMYAGVIVESALVGEIFAHPLHPYTQGLLDSLPNPETGKGKPLKGIKGLVPDLSSLPSGCRFRDRCPIAEDVCVEQEPELRDVGSGHMVRCYKV